MEAGTPHPLESFFWPQSIAVFGASPDPHRIRGLLLRYLRRTGYPGAILPINPSYAEIEGMRCYPDLAATGQRPDLAIVAIPASGVLAAAEDCAGHGVKHLVIISSGFAEEGGAAGDVQAELTALARRTGMRMAGPNCEGYWNALMPATTTFSPTVDFKEGEVESPRVSDRRIGVVAQSGGIGFSFFNRGRAYGLGFSYVISTGNEADLSLADFMDYMVRDERTHAVLIFCEAIRDPAGFLAAAAEARRRGKPVIAIKVGNSAAGARATASHTASLSGWQSAYAAAFRRHNIITAEDPDEALAIAGMLLTGPAPSGRRVGITTASGGGGAWMADTLTAHGLEVPILSGAVQERIRSYIPAYGSAQNPVDTTAAGAQTRVMQMNTLEILEASDEVDAIVMVTSLASETRVSVDQERIAPLIARGRKPITVWSYTLPSAFGRSQVNAAGLYVHTDLRGVGMALAKYAAFGARLRQAAPEAAAPRQAAVALPDGVSGILTEHRVKQLLSGYGLPASAEALATSAAEAAAHAVRLGFPVALKIQSPDIPHKTEAGGVRLNLADATSVTEAHGEVLAAARAHQPDARIEGVLVQKMAPKGVELVLGMVNDPTFGPVMMVGSGGVMVELLGDVAHGLAPLDAAEAEEMIRSLKLAKLLTGFRGSPPLDIAAVARLLVTLSQIAADHAGRIREMEFNPVIVHAGGAGLTIADALITLA
jgi:acyl-CoA synthetase (NDP forming)